MFNSNKSSARKDESALKKELSEAHKILLNHQSMISNVKYLRSTTPNHKLGKEPSQHTSSS